MKAYFSSIKSEGAPTAPAPDARSDEHNSSFLVTQRRVWAAEVTNVSRWRRRRRRRRLWWCPFGTVENIGRRALSGSRTHWWRQPLGAHERGGVLNVETWSLAF